MERQITEEQFEEVRIHMRDTYDVAPWEWDEEELIEAIYELLVSKNELLHIVSVSFLYEFVNEFADTEIPKEAIKETLDRLNEH